MSELVSRPALDGIRVLDLSEEVGGAYCGKLLADYGADVVLVEPPDGNPLRRRAPFAADGRSAAFAWYHGGKRSAVLALESPAGSARFRQLVAESDVLVDTCRPGRRETLGLDFATLRSWNPSLVVVSVTDFGQTGPYRDLLGGETVVQALSGQMFATGPADRPPLPAGVDICAATGGLHGYIGVLCALRLRERDGRARHVDVSNLEAGLENMELRAHPHWSAGADPTRADLHRPAVVPWGTYPCRDGVAALHGAPFRRWRSFARLLRGARFFEAVYAAGIARMERGDGASGEPPKGPKRLFFRLLDGAVRRWARRRSRDEILALGGDRGLAFGVLRELPEIPTLAQHRAREFFTEVDHPGLGPVSQPRWLFPAAGARCGPAPRHGEHDESPWSAPRTEARTPGSSQGSASSLGDDSGDALPLEGIRVLDLTLVEAAPHGTRVLADFGATVVKIEYPRRLDVFRGGALRDRAYDRQPLWRQLNRNKRSLTLDLTRKAGRAAFFELLEKCDVVVSNFRCGVLRSLGIDYEALRSCKPDIVTVNLSAYGSEGPDSHRPAYGGVIEAMSGVQNLTAHPGGSPERIREIDVLNGIAGAAAVLNALRRCDATGEGEDVDLSQMEATTHALMGDTLLALSAGAPPPDPRQTGCPRKPEAFPAACFPCGDGPDRWVHLLVEEPAQWRALASLIGREEWAADESLATARERRSRAEEIREAVAAWTSTRSPDEAMTSLQSAGVPAAAVRSLGEVLTDPHVVAREWFLPGGDGRFMGFPFRISGCAPPPPRGGPALGEANAAYREVIRDPEAKAALDFDPAELGSAFRLE